MKKKLEKYEKLAQVTVFDVDKQHETTNMMPLDQAISQKRKRDAMENGCQNADHQKHVAIKKKKIETLQDMQTCTACMENSRQVVFQPCSHFVACAACS